MAATVYITTLGCKVNQYDSGALLELFRAYGFEPCGRGKADPDVVIVNTCIVSSESERKSRQAIRRMRARRPHALLAVVGCYPQRFPERATAIEGVDYIYGISDHESLVKEIASRLRAGFAGGNAHARPSPYVKERTRTYIKIQDGCDSFCGYCIVPYTRGRSRSRAAQDILNEADAAVSHGTPEIVLTGINISSYGCAYGAGADTDNSTLGNISPVMPDDCDNRAEIRLGGLIKILSAHLLQKEYGGAPKSCDASELYGAPKSCDASELRGTTEYPDLSGLPKTPAGFYSPVRIRLSSLEPTVITPEFVNILSDCRKAICPHFHLSLQSGSGSVLRRMNRHYTPDMYLEAVSMLRGKFPEAGITTDIIVGLPGEGEEEFLETFDFCRKIAFSKIHVFPYSKRPGTRAAELPDQVDSSVKRDRAGRMLALSDELSQAFHAQYIGKDVEILVEKSTADRIEGLTANYIRVFANSKSDDLYNSPHIYKSYFQNNIQGAYAAVHITDAKPSHILGTIL